MKNLKVVDNRGRFKTIMDKRRFMGTMDADGNIVISPAMGFRVLGIFYDDITVAAIDAPDGLRYGLVNDKGEPICDFRYRFIEPWGSGYYRAWYSSKYNILRRDGTEVLPERYGFVSKVRHGLIIVSNTIPKTKQTPTRYTYAVVRADGQTIVPLGKYDTIRWLYTNDDEDVTGLYAQTLDCCYLLDFDGNEFNLVDGVNLLSDPRVRNILRCHELLPWEEVGYTVCHNCIFRDTILPDLGGCSQLNEKRAFRKQIIHSHFIGLTDKSCIYKKTSPDDQSLKEHQEEQEMLRLMKENDTFAIHLIRDFVDEKLQGDIDRLPEYDFSVSTRHFHFGAEPDDKYFDGKSAKDTPIVKAILSLVFKDAWNNLNYATFEQIQYRTCLVNPFTSLFGIRLAPGKYKALSPFRLSPQLIQRIESAYTLHQTIGNMLVLPNKPHTTYGNLTSYFERGFRIRGYMDKFLIELEDAFCQPRYADVGMVQLVHKCRKELLRYSRPPGFSLMCTRLMLDDFLDPQGHPRKVFDGIYCASSRPHTKAEYLHAIPQYLDFCEHFIPKRGRRIAQKLKEILQR